MAGVTVPLIPMAHQYLLTGAIEGVTADLPQLRDPDNLVYFREEVGGLCMGGYERDPAAFGLDGIPADFNHRLLDPDWSRFEPIMAGAIRRVPAIEDAPRHPDDQRAGGLHPGQRVHPRRERGPRVLRGRGVLGPRHRRRGRHRTPGRALDRRGRARARPVADGHPALRLPVPQPGAHAGARPSRTTRRTTTSTTRTRSAGPGGRCACRPPTRGWSRSAPSSARSPAGSARTGSSRTRTTPGRRWCGPRRPPAARLGGAELVSRDRRRGARDPAGGRACSTRARSPRSR